MFAPFLITVFDFSFFSLISTPRIFLTLSYILTQKSTKEATKSLVLIRGFFVKAFQKQIFILEEAMIKIQYISFPGSGHHLLVNLLTRYYGRDLSLSSGRYLNDTSKLFTAGPFVYCECGVGGHCRQIPCRDQRTTFQKYHDKKLDLKMNPSHSYIVQYRHPIHAIASLFMFSLRKHYKVEDSERGWDRFFKKKMRYWNGFCKKWIENNKHPSVYFLRYEDLIENTQKKLVEILRFIDPDSEVDHDWLQRVIESAQISYRHPINQFKYYDARKFAKYGL